MEEKEEEWGCGYGEEEEEEAKTLPLRFSVVGETKKGTRRVAGNKVGPWSRAA